MSAPPQNTPNSDAIPANDIPVFKLDELSLDDQIKDDIQKAVDKLIRMVATDKH